VLLQIIFHPRRLYETVIRLPFYISKFKEIVLCFNFTAQPLERLAMVCKAEGAGVRISSVRHQGRFSWPTQLPIQRVMGALSSGIKRPELEANHSLPTSSDIKEMWIYTSTPPCVFMAKSLINYCPRQFNFDVRVSSEIIISVNIKIHIFWHVMSCILVETSTYIFTVDKCSSRFPRNADIYLHIYTKSHSRRR
jgi:hypothetical protein